MDKDEGGKEMAAVPMVVGDGVREGGKEGGPFTNSPGQIIVVQHTALACPASVIDR